MGITPSSPAKNESQPPASSVLGWAASVCSGWRIFVLLLFHVVLSRLSYYNDSLFGFDSTAYKYLDLATLALLLGLVAEGILRYLVNRRLNFPYRYILDVGILGLFCAFFAMVFWKALTGGLVASADHITHFVRAILTEEDLIPYGRLVGWTSAIGAGIPLNELYPPGGNLLYCLFRAVTFGLLSQARSYNLLVYITYIGFALCFYSIARYYSGRLSAALVLLFLLLDDGEGVLFGWFQFFHSGMWATTLGVGVVFLAISSFAALSEGDSGKKHVVILVVGVCVATLLHPFSIALLAVWIAIILVLRFIFGSYRQFNSTPLLHALGWAALGFSLSCWWWGPFFASREWIQPYGFWGIMNFELGRDILNGTIFVGSYPFINVLALVGIVWGMFQRRLYFRSLSFFSLANILICTEFFRTAVRAPIVTEFFHHMQVGRLLFMGKLAGFILVSDLLAKVFAPAVSEAYTTWTSRIHSRTPSSLRDVLFRMTRDTTAITLGVLIVLPIVVFSLNVSNGVLKWGTELRMRSFEVSPEKPVYWKDYRAALSFILDREKLLPENRTFASPFVPFRIYVTEPWRMCSLVHYSPYGMVGPYYVSTVLLDTRPYQLNEDLLQLGNIKYILARMDQDAEQIEALSELTLLAEFGTIKVYEWQDWEGKSYRLDGDGSVTLTQNEPWHVQFRISDVREPTVLWIGISRYRKWTMTLNGETIPPLEVENSPEHPEIGKFLCARVHNGTLDIHYRAQAIDRFAQIASVTGIIVFVVLSIDPLKRKVCEKSSTSVRALKTWVFSTGHTIEIAFYTVCTFLIVGSIVILVFRPLSFRPEYAQCLGAWYDVVGKETWEPDGTDDLEWVIYLNVRKGIKLDSILITRLDQDENVPTPAKWTTDLQPFWKITVFDDLGRRRDSGGERTNISLDRSQRIFLYAGNCFPWQPPPSFRVRVDLGFSDGSQQSFNAP
ncbi:MAG: hypothetical protein ABIH23_05225 [bacterium]